MTGLLYFLYAFTGLNLLLGAWLLYEDSLRHRAAPASRPAARWLALAGGLLVAASFFTTVPELRFRGGLDPSWQLVLEHASFKSLAYGRDIVFTFGPLGPLSADLNTGQGLLTPERNAFVLWTATLYGLIWWRTAKDLPMVALVAFCLWSLLFPSFLIVYTALALLAWMLHPPTASHRGETLLAWGIAPASLALLSLVKFTYWVAAVAVIGVWVVGNLFRKKPLGALVQPLVFVVTGVLAWHLSGQDLQDLPTWIATGFAVSAAYADAMQVLVLPPLAIYLATAMLVISAGIIIAVHGLRIRPLNIPYLCLALTCLGQMAIHWKHSVVRADEHLALIAQTAPLLVGVAMVPLLRSAAVSARANGVIASVFLLLAGLSLTVQAGAFGRSWQEEFSLQSKALGGRLASLSNLSRSERAADTAEKEALALPAMSKILGDQPVDVFNYLQAAAFANPLNYQPRPVFQSYQSCSNALIDINPEYWAKRASDRHLICRMESVDGRLPGSEDAACWPLWLTTMEPVLAEKEFLLLSPQHPQNASRLEWKAVHSGTARWNESIPVPPTTPGTLVRLKFTMAQSLYGKLVKAVFQAETINLEVTMTDTTKHRARVVPAVGSSGVLVRPYLETNADLVGYFARVPAVEKAPASFLLQPAGERENELRESFTHTLEIATPSSQPSPESLGRYRELLLGMPLYQQYPLPAALLDVMPGEVVRFSRKRISTAEIDGAPAIRVDAPTTIVVKNKPEGGILKGTLVLPEKTWAIKKPTDGVRFRISTASHEGAETSYLDRHLDPARVEADRGTQRYRLEIPPSDHPWLILRTAPGTSADKDWATWGKCEWVGK